MPQSPSSSSSSEADIRAVLEQCLRWHNGDKYREDPDEANRAAWEDHKHLLENTLASLAATPPSLPIDFKQASELLAMFGGEAGMVSLQIGDGHSGRGLYAHASSYPEEGAVFLGVADEEAAPKQASEQGEMEAEEDAWVIDRLSKLLAGVAIALKGEERPRHRHSFHDLPDVAQVLKLELDLYRATIPNGVPESATAGVSDCGISDEQLWSAYLTILNWVEYVGKEEAIAKARAALSPSPHPEEGALLLGGDEGGKKGGA